MVTADGDTSSEPRRGTRAGLARRLLRHPAGAGAGAFILAVALACALAPLIAPYGANDQDLGGALSAPSAHHPLGTDQLGRDVLSRLLYGGVGSLVGILEALAVTVALGLVLGLIAGYRSGWLDGALSRLADLGMAIPAIVVLLTTYAVFPNNQHVAMVVFGVLLSARLFRVVRGVAIGMRDDLYVRAARIAGRSHAYILLRHLLPRAVGPLVVNASIIAAAGLLVQTGLNYLGLGVRPPAPSWGGMVAEAQTVIQLQPWLFVPSGALIGLMVLAFVLLGNGVRSTFADSRTGAAPAARPPRSARAATAPATPAGPADPDAYELRGLSVVISREDREIPIVRDIGFRIRPGEAVGLVGESGCGKSMTARALVGTLPRGARIDAGEFLFDGHDLFTRSRRERAAVRGRGIAFVSQQTGSSLDPCFTVGAQLAELVRRHHGGSRSAAMRQAVELLETVHLPSAARVAKRYPHELSGGMAQRVSIALALAGDPRLLVADEPTTALDVTVQAEILALFRALQRERGMAILFISHDLAVVEQLCERVVVLYAGQVVEDADAAGLVAGPAHPYTRALLAANPELAPVGEPLPTIPGVVPQPGEWPAGCHFASRCAFASEACDAGPIALEPANAGTVVRCVKHDRLPVGVSRA